MYLTFFNNGCIIQIETVKNVQTIKGGERMLLEERLDEIVKEG